MLIVLIFFVFRLKIPTELIGYRGHSAFFLLFQMLKSIIYRRFRFIFSVDVKERLQMN